MHHHIFVAGTFDGLHAGHRTLLARAFAVGERVTIGLTSDAFINQFKISNFKFQIRGYEERKKALELWLQGQGFSRRATITPISDSYEPAASMKDLDALVVTNETRKRGEEINDIRLGRSLSPLALVEAPIVPAEDGVPISSTRMRNGEIDPDGRLVMPEKLRLILGKPLGRILTGVAIDTSIASYRDKNIITVGDMATKTILDADVVPVLAIIDGKVGRKPFHEVIDRLQSENGRSLKATAVKSGPGFISREAAQAIQDCFIHPSSRITHHAIIIDGEEDLLVLPAIMHAPLGSVLYYGQPPLRSGVPRDFAGQAGEGLVEVVVTEKMKRVGATLLHAFI